MRAPSIELLRALRSTLSPRPIERALVCPSRIPRHATQTRTLSYRSTADIRLRSSHRALTTSSTSQNQPRPKSAPNPFAPRHTDRGPKSTEDTQTDFSAMDVLGSVPTPATSIDACTTSGFHLDNGVKTEAGAGLILVGGEAFAWRPWADTPQQTMGGLLDVKKGVVDFSRSSLGVLEMVFPKPDLVIIGTGGRLWMLGKETRRVLAEVLGCRVDVMDTANAAAAYNLLAKERGIEGGSGVGGLFLPIGWVGVKR